MPINSKILVRSFFFTIVGITIVIYIWDTQSNLYLSECLQSGRTDCNLSAKLKEDLSNASLLWIVVVSLIYLLSNVIRAFRWHMLLRSISPQIRFWNVLYSIIISYLCNLVIARSGEFIQVGTIAKYENQKYEEIIGTLIFERIVDFIALLTFILLGILLSYESLIVYINQNLHPDLIAYRLYVLGGLAIIGSVVLIIFFKLPIKGRTLNNRFKQIVKGIKRGLLAFTKLPNKLAFVAYTVALWSCYYLMMYGSFLIFEFSRNLRAVDALMVSVCGSLGTILPTPGGVGGYHAMVMEGMSILGIGSTEGISFAIITYFILNILCVLIFGLYAVISLFIYNR